MELLKTRMQVHGKTGISDAVRSIYGQTGLGGFSRGLGYILHPHHKVRNCGNFVGINIYNLGSLETVLM